VQSTEALKKLFKSKLYFTSHDLKRIMETEGNPQKWTFVQKVFHIKEQTSLKFCTQLIILFYIPVFEVPYSRKVL
jgi:hypothetical protein